jgi:hypothetical protein
MGMEQVTEKAERLTTACGVLRAPAFSWKGGGDVV